jgi:HAD superfamily hydrolase (TIGR01509 family)
MFKLIKSKKILVGIASNAIRKNVKMILSELKIYEEFDSIICGDEVRKGKPNPEMFNETVDRFNLKKEECLIFEDSVEGVSAAFNSRVDVVGITSSTSGKILIDKGCKTTIDNYLNFDMSIYG